MDLKRKGSVLLSLLIMTPTFSYATTMNCPTVLNQDATLIDVTVPLSLPINVDSKGVVQTANGVNILNNSCGPIIVDSVLLQPKDSWSISDFDKDYSSERLGLKEFGFKLNDVKADVDGVISLTAKEINGGSSLGIDYDATLSPQKDNIVDTNIADVVFTVGWGSGVKFYPELSDKWETGLSPMPTSRGYATSDVIDDKIYVIGGYTGKYNVNTVEVYDPATDSWETKTPMSYSRSGASSALVDGKIYVIGGYNGSLSNIVEMYDPVTDTWETKASMPTKRHLATASVVDGKIYVMGGEIDRAITDKVEVYDPVTDTWETKSSLPVKVNSATSQVVDGKIYVIGGNYSSRVQVYDPATDSWETKTPMPTNRELLTSQVIDGKIYCIGGYTSTKCHKVVEVYDTATDTWETKTDMPIGKGRLTSGLVNGKIYCIGGYDSWYTNTVESYDTGWRYN